MEKGEELLAIRLKTSDIVTGGLWRLFPTINCDRVEDIPADYPGPMGVPITFMAQFNTEQFELVGMARPKIGNRILYRRVIIRNLKPVLPEYIELELEPVRAGSGKEASHGES